MNHTSGSVKYLDGQRRERLRFGVWAWSVSERGVSASVECRLARRLCIRALRSAEPANLPFLQSIKQKEIEKEKKRKKESIADAGPLLGFGVAPVELLLHVVGIVFVIGCDLGEVTAELGF